TRETPPPRRIGQEPPGGAWQRRPRGGRCRRARTRPTRGRCPPAEPSVACPYPHGIRAPGVPGARARAGWWLGRRQKGPGARCARALRGVVSCLLGSYLTARPASPSPGRRRSRPWRVARAARPCWGLAGPVGLGSIPIATEGRRNERAPLD